MTPESTIRHLEQRADLCRPTLQQLLVWAVVLLSDALDCLAPPEDSPNRHVAPPRQTLHSCMQHHQDQVREPDNMSCIMLCWELLEVVILRTSIEIKRQTNKN